MPCPYLSRDRTECLLAEETADDDEDPGVPADDLIRREWCLGEPSVYRNCPAFRRHLADLLR